MPREKEKKNLSKIQIPIEAAMSSVGVFHKVENRDGKPFLVCTLTQTDYAPSSGDALAMDSSGDDLPLQPLFSCPRARERYQLSRLMKDGDDGQDYDEETNNITRNMYDCIQVDELVDKELLPYNSSPYFPSTRKGGGSLLECDKRYFCKFPVVPRNKKPDSEQIGCALCQLPVFSTSYYACRECGEDFHKECVESPLEIKHPSHPFHNSLQLCTPLDSMRTWEDCTSCGRRLMGMSYNCTTCELRMHSFCAIRPIPFVVYYRKSHPHPLTFFPTQASLVCHFCATIKKFDPTYICIQCGFAIHKGCISSPQVIRISRHHHRVSFTSSLPSRKLSCAVCHQEVDNHYGSYSCNRCDAYFVHSKCALNRKVWDGKNLDGVPEEDDKIDDGEPFERIAYGIIRHPFHSHHLRLEIFKDYDENKYCRGCAFPIYGGRFYSCMECDFILHEGCANALRMKRHPSHPKPLTLEVTTMAYERGRIKCEKCQHDVSGFYYDGGSIKLDLQCASINEPFRYLGHTHPLFLPWDQHRKKRCQICEEECEESKLICMEWDYTICFRCVTLPYKVRYKHDSHFLTLCDKKEPSDEPDWCEICEGKIAEGTKICEGRIEEEIAIWIRKKQRRERRYYECNSCCTSLHVECLLGLDIYMKSGQVLIKDIVASFKGLELKRSTYHMNMDVQIRVNSSLSRPICDRCKRRCPFPIYFIAHHRTFCSWYCTENAKY